MAPRKKNAAIKSTGSTSSKAEPLPDWVKNKSLAKPPPKYQQQQEQQQQQQQRRAATPSQAGATASSTKDASSQQQQQQSVQPPRPPPLFPPGSKTPINLLNERIQKHHAPKGWLRPSIEARRAKPKEATGDGSMNGDTTSNGGDEGMWTFVVTLMKTNKSDQSSPFVVRFDARDFSGHEGSCIALDSKEKAKHWGATYALFRLCSNLSLESVLPTGPREYWKDLASHKSKAPEHLAWLWSPDPFEAQQKLNAEKQAKQAAREKKVQEAEKGPKLSKAWMQAREVRMAKDLRDMVEQTVREALQVFPMEGEEGDNLQDSAATSGTTTPMGEHSIDESNLIKKLNSLGFRSGHARSATRWLSLARKGQSSSAAASSLRSVANLSDLDACLEYLAIFCPEDDLPPAFGPSRKADSFVTQASSGSGGSGLALRWIEDRLVKLAGFPRTAVAEALVACSDIPVEAKEGLCLDILLRKLANAESTSIPERARRSQAATRLQRDARADERMTLEAVLGPERIIEVSPTERQLTSEAENKGETYDIRITQDAKEDVRLRICPGDLSDYPAENAQVIPTFYVASSILPAYLRLALTRRLARALLNVDPGYNDWKEMLGAGQGGVILSMVEDLESKWQRIADDPPELSVVMAGVSNTPKLEAATAVSNGKEGPGNHSIRKTKRTRTTSVLKNDAATNERLKSQQVSLLQSKEYAPMKKARASLPAIASSNSIIQILEKHRLLIIVGETGCGKTTQCPQFVLDDMIERGLGSMCNIVVTQPRRLSAMGVASRVAAERCEALDGKGQVGYSIRGESKSGRDTRLLFTTTGVLLRRLSSNDPDLRGISHVFVDEVHERGVDSDLLLLELREILKRNPNIRIILMSATIEKETFAQYFDGAPCIDIPGRTFPVTDHYLEDVHAMLDLDSEEGEERRKKRDGIDYELLGKTVKMICQRAESNGNANGGVLVFAPGVGEIRMAIEAIRKYVHGESLILPLHANLTPDEQRKVFAKSQIGTRKIIVSTNVAEASITIDDIVYVVDLGLVKETRYDPQSGLTRLVETRCSQAAARQRRGRAGRVRPGECFRLYTRGTEHHRMDPQQVPEMRRMSLENLILTVKALKGDDTRVEDYLGKAISPPSTEAITTAIRLLLDMCILSAGERLSALGKHLSLLPLDVRLGKLLVLGCVFHCLEPMLTAAAILSSKPLFNAPFERRDEAAAARSKFAIGSSDILTDVNAYQQWADRRQTKEPHGAIRQWCEENFVSQSSLRDIANVRTDLLGYLSEMGFVPASYRRASRHSAPLDVSASDVNLQRALLLAGLYPSIVRIVHPPSKYDKAIGGTVERQAEARQVRYMDNQGQRVFLHPSSVLFSMSKYSSDFLASFRRSASQQKGKGDACSANASGDKIFLRDATEVPLFALLLFGGRLRVHRMEGGISMGDGGSAAEDNEHHDAHYARNGREEEGWIKLRAGGRIASLVNQLRFLLDAALAHSFEDPTQDVFSRGIEARVRDCLQRIIEYDGQQ